VRRAAAKGLGILRWQEMSKEKVEPAQKVALEVLLKVTQDPEWVVRYAAILGLQRLAIALHQFQSSLLTSIMERFEQMITADESQAVRARVWLACEQLMKEIDLPSIEPPEGMLIPSPPEAWPTIMERLYMRKLEEREQVDPLQRFKEMAIALEQEKLGDVQQ
jgi:phycocyanobilin lyase subunit beta